MDENMKGTKGTVLNLGKLGAPEISLGIFSRVVNIDGTCWISGQSMHAPSLNAFKDN